MTIKAKQVQINKELVTIGIPSYKRPLTLERTINSIINQTYQNLEIIISDNCSTDNQIDELVRLYCAQDHRITYIKQEKNLGATKNFSYLLETASGKYFMWMADDDYISQDYVMEIMQEFKKNKNYSLIGGQGYFINEVDDIKIENERICLSSNSPSQRFMRYLNVVQSNSIFYGIFRTKDITPYNMHFYGSDWLHVARLAFKGKVKTLEHIFVYRNNGGVSQQYYSYFERRRIYINIYKYFKRDILSSSLYKELSPLDLAKLIKDVKKSISCRIPPLSNVASKAVLSSFIKIVGINNYQKLKKLFYLLTQKSVE